MYKPETLKKYTEKVNEISEKYMDMDAEEIKLCISHGNSKIGRAMNVSLPAIFTCANCSKCQKICYDVKACMQYKTCIDARVRNHVLLLKDRDRYFDLIEQKISRRRKNKFFRWHVSGDIIDIGYLDRMCKIAADHPDFVFWTYTKNYSVVNDCVRTNGGSIEAAIPANLTIMFSEWRGMAMINPYGFPIFSVQFDNETDAEFAEIHPEITWTCPGNCDVCKAACRGCIAGENTKCHEH